MQRKVLGKNPAGTALAKVKKSSNYKNGSFQNLTPTDVMLKGASTFKMMRDFFNKPKAATPNYRLPSLKTDLKSLSSDKPVIIWFGHSSYFITYKGKNILIDPVFSGSASPVSLFVKSFNGTDTYTTDDFPNIDLLIITHDHYDHLDYRTIQKIAGKTQHFYAPLGVGQHLNYWGIPLDRITEFDWWESKSIEKDIELIATPARHFSGRGFTRNKTLWTSYVLKLYGYSIFIGGDSGYDTHFKEIGDQYGPFDIALLETGQYNELWPHIHMMPEETVEASIDLNAKVLLPVHWGKFALAYHEWNEPIKRVKKSAAEHKINITTPMIGEPVILDLSYPDKEWWNV